MMERSIYQIELVKEKTKWIRITSSLSDFIIINKIYKVKYWAVNHPIVIGENGETTVIPLSIYEPATKAEIKAHKLGFHVGNEVRVHEITKKSPNPKLFLWEIEVIIKTLGAFTYIGRVDFSISKKDWMKWYDRFINVWPNVEYCEMSMGNKPVKLYKQENYISIGNIDKITYEQIKAITEQLNQLK